MTAFLIVCVILFALNLILVVSDEDQTPLSKVVTLIINGGLIIWASVLLGG